MADDEDIISGLRERRNDAEFRERLRARVAEDRPMLDRMANDDPHATCQSSDGPVRFYYAHWPTHGFVQSEHVYVSCPHHGLDPLPNDGRWTIKSVHPLTVTPSVHWSDCGCHGYITDGKWVPA